VKKSGVSAAKMVSAEGNGGEESGEETNLWRWAIKRQKLGRNARNETYQRLAASRPWPMHRESWR
jgi:hypothetical protein